MVGTIVNAAAILVGGAIGCLLRGGIPKRVSNAITQAAAMPIVLIGILSAIQTKNTIVVILAMVIGALIGTLVRIDDGMHRFGNMVERLIARRSETDAGKEHEKEGAAPTFGEGFVYASLVFCIGAMAVVGSLESGITGNHTTLFAKALLDGILSVILVSTMGPGVIASAFSVFVFQGTITLASSFLQPILTDAIITELAAVGGLLVMGIGTNLMHITNIKIADLLPAVFLPMGLMPLMDWIGTLI